MNLIDYLAAMRSALQSPGARCTYFPPDKAERRDRCLVLGVQIGYALADFDPLEVRGVLGGLYSTLLVANSFDSTGVPLDAKEWVAAIQKGIELGQKPAGGLAYQLAVHPRTEQVFGVQTWGTEIVGLCGPLDDEDLAQVRVHGAGWLDYDVVDLDWARRVKWAPPYPAESEPYAQRRDRALALTEQMNLEGRDQAEIDRVYDEAMGYRPPKPSEY